MPIARKAPVDPELAVAPVRARDIAVRTAGTGAQCPVLNVGVFPRFHEVDELEKFTLEKRDRLQFRLFLRDLIGREIFQFLVGLDTVPNPYGINAFTGMPLIIFGRNCRVQVVGVPPTRKRSLAGVIDAIVRKAGVTEHEKTVETIATFRDDEARS